MRRFGLPVVGAVAMSLVIVLALVARTKEVVKEVEVPGAPVWCSP